VAIVSLDALNQYARRFAERLFAVYPDWRAVAMPDPDGDPPPASLLVTVAAPVGDRALSLRTYGEQVTVEFGPHGWHEHVGTWSGPTEDAAFDAALALVADLLAERVAVVAGVRGDRPVWFRLLREGAEPPRPWGIPGLSAQRVEVYSWRGSRDATLYPAWRPRKI
jgi:hypothetical protein